MGFPSSSLTISASNNPITSKLTHKTNLRNGEWDKDFKNISRLRMAAGQFGIEIDLGKLITALLLLASKLMAISQSILPGRTKAIISIIWYTLRTLMAST